MFYTRITAILLGKGEVEINSVPETFSFFQCDDSFTSVLKLLSLNNAWS
jgi:hypothetical protein